MAPSRSPPVGRMALQRVCRVWHRARSSVYARRQATRSPALCRRRGPIGAAPDDVLVAHIRRVLEASPFHGEGYRKAWAKLRVAGMRTSKERVRRLMREHDLQAPPRAGHAHGPKAHDGTITTEAPDVMWGHRHDGHRDGRRGGGLRLRGRRSLRDRMHRAPCRQARDPLRGPGADPPGHPRNASGASAKAWPVGCGCVTTTGRTTWPTIFNRRSRSSASKAPPSFVREPEGNGVAERFIRTLKENLLWVRSFETIEELRLALLEFKRTYNEQWMLEKYDYRSPAQVRRDLLGLDAAA